MRILYHQLKFGIFVRISQSVSKAKTRGIGA